MTWRVFFGDETQADIERLNSRERLLVNEVLVSWVEVGPPRGRSRAILGVEAFYEDEVLPGITFTYSVDDDRGYVAVLRVRRRGA